MASAHLASVLAIAAVLATGCAEHVQLVVRPPVGGNVSYLFWPPPASTAVWTAKAAQTPPSFGEVADRVGAILKAAGYAEQRWYPVGARFAHGFAITTRLERVADDGSPAAGAARWLPTLRDACELSWFGGARDLRLKAPSGRYRALLVAFTDLPLTRQPHRVWEWNEQTVMAGANLPSWVLPSARRPSSAYHLGVYVYEYAADSSDDEVRFLPADTKVSAKAHVDRAGLTALADVTSTSAAVRN